jgi:hypothetical protein
VGDAPDVGDAKDSDGPSSATGEAPGTSGDREAWDASGDQAWGASEDCEAWFLSGAWEAFGTSKDGAGKDDAPAGVSAPRAGCVSNAADSAGAWSGRVSNARAAAGPSECTDGAS